MVNWSQDQLTKKSIEQVIMEFKIEKSSLAGVQPMRDLFLSENTFQFIYNKCHAAGWADVYLFTLNDTQVGYGSVWGKDRREDRDTIFEFFLSKPFRKYAEKVFAELIRVSATGFVECQSNDVLLTQMLYEFSNNIYAEAILFEDEYETTFTIQGIRFVKAKRRVETQSIRWNRMVKLWPREVSSGIIIFHLSISIMK
ncbi:MAG: hypothetical protein WDM78_06350 [Puia sp.]